tara:strand:- start:2074 stop:2310 length:237 start_codon:yes stop_codon:yes gene_type:complete
MKKILISTLLFIIIGCGEEPTHHPSKHKNQKDMSDKKVIIDKIDSRLETKFIFFRFWKYHSDICINVLSKQTKEYFKN